MATVQLSALLLLFSLVVSGGRNQGTRVVSKVTVGGMWTSIFLMADF
jgi:hypothetical protein